MRISVLSTPEAGLARPRAFHLGGRRVAIAGVLRHWEAPGYRYFHVRDLDGRGFVLRQCAQSGDWELETVYARLPKARKLSRELV